MTSVKREIIAALQDFQDEACNYQLSLLMASFSELYNQQFGKDALLMYVKPTQVPLTAHNAPPTHRSTTPPTHLPTYALPHHTTPPNTTTTLTYHTTSHHTTPHLTSPPHHTTITPPHR